jgi:hypothetical protein
VFLATSRCSSRGAAPSRSRWGFSPSGLAPLQSMTRVAAHRRARSQRFAIPKRNPAVEIHHSRAFACPGHVAPSRLPCASAPYSLDGLPGIAFNQVRSRDPRPSELDLTAVAARLSAPAVPLAIGQAGPLSTQSCAVIGASSELEAGLASGLVPLPVGIRSSGVPSHHGSWLSWVSPPWGSPLPCSDLYGSRAIRNRLPPEPRSPLVER